MDSRRFYIYAWKSHISGFNVAQLKSAQHIQNEVGLTSPDGSPNPFLRVEMSVVPIKN